MIYHVSKRYAGCLHLWNTSISSVNFLFHNDFDKMNTLTRSLQPHWKLQHSSHCDPISGSIPPHSSKIRGTIRFVQYVLFVFFNLIISSPTFMSATEKKKRFCFRSERLHVLLNISNSSDSAQIKVVVRIDYFQHWVEEYVRAVFQKRQIQAPAPLSHWQAGGLRIGSGRDCA